MSVGQDLAEALVEGNVLDREARGATWATAACIELPLHGEDRRRIDRGSGTAAAHQCEGYFQRRGSTRPGIQGGWRTHHRHGGIAVRVADERATAPPWSVCGRGVGAEIGPDRKGAVAQISREVELDAGVDRSVNAA